MTSTAITNIFIIIFLSLLAVFMFVMIKPFIVQVAVERALASAEFVSYQISHLITISNAAPQNITINFQLKKITADTVYNLTVDEREVTACHSTTKPAGAEKATTEEEVSECSTSFAAIPLYYQNPDFSRLIITKTRGEKDFTEIK